MVAWSSLLQRGGEKRAGFRGRLKKDWPWEVASFLGAEPGKDLEVENEV